jgi:benzil reductase ((S)-benzoin forming)
MKLALVTGTTSGIGEAIAHRLLDRGWHVVGIARRDASVAHESYTHLAADLQDTTSLTGDLETRLIDLLETSPWARVGLVNNAAHPGLLGPLARLDPQELTTVLEVNVVAPVWLMGVFVRRAPSAARLRIVNVSSGASQYPFAGLGPYSIAKAGLRMAGMILETELDRTRDVTILSYEPAAVDTPMQDLARSTPRETLPSLDMFMRFRSEKLLLPPSAPANEIADYLETDGHRSFDERRYGV